MMRFFFFLFFFFIYAQNRVEFIDQHTRAHTHKHLTVSLRFNARSKCEIVHTAESDFGYPVEEKKIPREIFVGKVFLFFRLCFYEKSLDHE